MKTLITILLIISFVSIAVFGLSMMHVGSHEICPIVALQGADCTLVSNPLQLAAIHLNAFLALSLATLLALVLVAYALISNGTQQNSRSPDPSQYYRRHTPFESRFQILARRWFSRFEHSPTISR